MPDTRCRTQYRTHDADQSNNNWKVLYQEHATYGSWSSIRKIKSKLILRGGVHILLGEFGEVELSTGTELNGAGFEIHTIVTSKLDDWSGHY